MLLAFSDLSQYQCHLANDYSWSCEVVVGGHSSGLKITTFLHSPSRPLAKMTGMVCLIDITGIYPANNLKINTNIYLWTMGLLYNVCGNVTIVKPVIPRDLPSAGW
jgi:hypothetical protein